MFHDKILSSRAMLASLTSCIVLGCAGCPSLDNTLGKIGAKRSSFDIEGEVVSLQLLSRIELLEEIDVYQLESELADPIGQDSIAALTTAAVTAAVDLGYDLVVEQVAKEKNRYTQSFSGSRFISDFWTTSERKSDGGAIEVKLDGAQYVGFKLRRSSKGFKNAFVLICVFRESADKSLLIVSPLVLDVQSSKAKSRSELVEHEIEIASWVTTRGSKGEVNEQPGGKISWKQSLKIGGAPAVFNGLTTEQIDANDKLIAKRKPVSHREVGMDLGVLVAPRLVGEASALATMKLMVKVTQSDPTATRRVVEKIEATLNDKSDDAKKAVINLIGFEEEDEGGQSKNE